jgi:hypothetical protein
MSNHRKIKKMSRMANLTLGFSFSSGLLRYSLFSALIIATFAQSGNAQETFYSPKVDSLYKLVNQVCPMDSICDNNMVFQCAELVKGDTVPVILCKDEIGVVDHVGFCFLPDSIRMVNIPVIQFLEREMLTLLVTKDISAILSAYRNDGLLLMVDDAPMGQINMQNKGFICSMLKDCKGITLNRVEKDYSVTIYSSNGHRLSFSFPADCELISGMDKKEQEIRLAFQLQNHAANTIDSLIPLPDRRYLQLLQNDAYRDSIYVEKGERFVIPQINNDLFYFKNDSIYTLVSDTSLIALSFSNALLAPSTNHYTIDVKHRMYGLAAQDYSIDSRDFNDYFSQGFERYFGIETLEPEHLSGTLILYNRDEEFIHLFYVTTTLNDLVSGGKMMMELYSNIPQHNIESLY